ncbi:unnamed protein product [marine sediment metagenome]|uniref:Uncharacterized protein n=1 Tax=marine sediment metagenome TaxID=412755 RepID=X1CE55_9ZZZZ
MGDDPLSVKIKAKTEDIRVCSVEASRTGNISPAGMFSPKAEEVKV